MLTNASAHLGIYPAIELRYLNLDPGNFQYGAFANAALRETPQPTKSRALSNRAGISLHSRTIFHICIP